MYECKHARRVTLVCPNPTTQSVVSKVQKYGVFITASPLRKHDFLNNVPPSSADNTGPASEAEAGPAGMPPLVDSDCEDDDDNDVRQSVPALVSDSDDSDDDNDDNDNEAQPAKKKHKVADPNTLLPKLHNATRWSSIHDMFSRMLAIREHVLYFDSYLR